MGLSPHRILLHLAQPLLFALYRISSKKPKPPLKVPKSNQRVLVSGASSGIGRSVARQCAARGARVCVVGRREALVEEVAVECRNAQKSARWHDVLGVAGDFTNVQDMVWVRDALEKEWNELNALVVTAGVSALQPLLAIAGVKAKNKINL